MLQKWLPTYFCLSSLLVPTVTFAKQTLSIPLTLQSGLHVNAQLLLPDHHLGPTSNRIPIPAFLVFGGFQDAARILDLLAPWVDRERVALASFDYPYTGPRKFVFPDSLSDVPKAKRMIGDTVEGIVLLYRALQTRNDIRSSEIILVGASLGAPFVLQAAANDPSIQKTALLHGFGQVERIAHIQLQAGFVRKGWPTWLAGPVSWILARSAWWYLGQPSPELSAELLGPNQRVLYVTAVEDSIIPLDAREALWQGLRRSKAVVSRVDISGDHFAAGSEPMDSKIQRHFDVVLKWNRGLVP